jgi:hypothetical protein
MGLRRQRRLRLIAGLPSAAAAEATCSVETMALAWEWQQQLQQKCEWQKRCLLWRQPEWLQRLSSVAQGLRLLRLQPSLGQRQNLYQPCSGWRMGQLLL